MHRFCWARGVENKSFLRGKVVVCRLLFAKFIRIRLKNITCCHLNQRLILLRKARLDPPRGAQRMGKGAIQQPLVQDSIHQSKFG